MLKELFFRKSSVTGRIMVKYEPYTRYGIYGVVGIPLYAIDLVGFGM